jgi:hypothetical protein
MNQEVTQLAETILTYARERREPLELYEVLWTIDALQRLIASAEEINAALARVEGICVERTDSFVLLQPCDSVEQARVTEKDLDTAMKNYRAAAL